MKRTIGSRIAAAGQTNVSTDSSAMAAMARPATISQRGVNRCRPATTETPATSRPNGTTNPGPPAANENMCSACATALASGPPACASAHAANAEVANATDAATPPTRAMWMPATFMPRNCKRLDAVAVKMPSGTAEQKIRNADASAADGYSANQSGAPGSKGEGKCRPEAIAVGTATETRTRIA